MEYIVFIDGNWLVLDCGMYCVLCSASPPPRAFRVEALWSAHLHLHPGTSYLDHHGHWSHIQVLICFSRWCACLSLASFRLSMVACSAEQTVALEKRRQLRKPVWPGRKCQIPSIDTGVRRAWSRPVSCTRRDGPWQGSKSACSLGKDQRSYRAAGSQLSPASFLRLPHHRSAISSIAVLTYLIARLLPWPIVIACRPACRSSMLPAHCAYSGFWPAVAAYLTLCPCPSDSLSATVSVNVCGAVSTQSPSVVYVCRKLFHFTLVYLAT